MSNVILSIAGSDSSGVAGLDADLRAIEACGGFPATVLTAVTEQGDDAVHEVWPLGPDRVRTQLRRVLERLDVRAIKSGMLVDAPTVHVVAEELRNVPEIPLVCDPVIASSSGGTLLDAGGVRALLEALIPRAALLTPNAHEAAALTGLSVRDAEDAERAGRALLGLGCRAVLVKGGHLVRDRGTDVLVRREGTVRYDVERPFPGTVRASGCMLASAIATFVGSGVPLEGAVGSGKRYVARAFDPERPPDRSEHEASRR